MEENLLPWRPSATLQTIKARAELYSQIRDFFANRLVLEVETPVLDQFAVTDAFIESISARYKHANKTSTLYLQTSPEYAMKRLLASGCGSIYQITKAFRNDECGSFHHYEFSMLEWYHIEFNHHQLMDEMDALLQKTINSNPAHRISYEDLFLQYFSINPHCCELKKITSLLKKHNIELSKNIKHFSKDDALQLLLSHVIEPTLGFDRPVFIYDYPKTQAALAKIKNDRACRFEAYINGIELANGFYELTDAQEQMQRFEKDNVYRKKHHLSPINIDTRFIAALKHGLPECSGVALGLDRLLMIKTGEKHISNVLCFTSLNNGR